MEIRIQKHQIHCTHRTHGFPPARRNLTEVCFERLDVAIGKLVALARKNDATVIVMSDHGHGSLDGKAQPNLLLAQWGYLGLRSPFSRALTRTSVWWNRYVGKNGSFAGLANMNRDLAIDWARSRACVGVIGPYTPRVSIRRLPTAFE